jgi:DNA (cytosine-5)-methyltransferase 1
MKILNLYACLGGNRYKWDEVADDLEITAVELDPEAARLYQERFPNDKVIIADAHQYLLDHYKEFDFIWSSPPCPTHSKARYWGFGKNGLKPEYPDMKLYEEIIFLKYHFFGKWVVENVNPYYEPMFNPVIRERHTYWANFHIPYNISNRNDTALVQASRLKDLCDFHDYDFKKYKGEQRILKMARNLVDYEAGKTILETALNIVKKSNTNQISIFDEVQELQGEV